jgi:hypothetical protein
MSPAGLAVVHFTILILPFRPATFISAMPPPVNEEAFNQGSQFSKEPVPVAAIPGRKPPVMAQFRWIAASAD